MKTIDLNKISKAAWKKQQKKDDEKNKKKKEEIDYANGDDSLPERREVFFIHHDIEIKSFLCFALLIKNYMICAHE